MTPWFKLKALAGDLGVKSNTGEYNRCPNVGRWAPEFAAGKWKDILNIAFDAGYERVLHLKRGLSDEQHARLLDAWKHGRLFVIEFLTLKLAFWIELPYILCALGLESEDDARQLLRQAYAKFLATSDALHHRITLEYFGQSPLAEEMHKFLMGTPLGNLGLLLNAKAKMRCIPMNETTIEAKHAITTSESKKITRISYATASLFARMPLLQDSMESQDDFLLKLTPFCEKVRRVDDLVVQFNLGTHTSLVRSYEYHGRFSKKDTKKILYHADTNTKFLTHAAAKQKLDESLKRRKKASELYERDHRPALNDGFTDASQRLLWHHACNHFSSVGQEGRIYSSRIVGGLPTPLLGSLSGLQSCQCNQDVGTLETLLEHPTDTAHGLRDIDLRVCAQAPTGPNRADGDRKPEAHFFFELLNKKPSAYKTVRLGAGVAGHLENYDVTVALMPVQENRLQAGQGVELLDPFVADQWRESRDAASMVQVWRLPKSVNPDTLETHIVEWRPGLSSVCAIRHPSLLDEPWELLCDVASELLAQDALETLQEEATEGNVASWHVAKNVENKARIDLLHRMEGNRMAKCINENTHFSCWQLTVEGQAALRFAQPLEVCSLPMAVRTEIPLGDMTTYELVMSLFKQGWQCETLVPFVRASTLRPYMPLEDQPIKTFYIRPSDAAFHRDYLTCLLTERSFWEELHVDTIAHCLEGSHYSWLLSGKQDVEQPAIEDAAGPLAIGDGDPGMDTFEDLFGSAEDFGTEGMHPGDLDDQEKYF